MAQIERTSPARVRAKSASGVAEERYFLERGTRDRVVRVVVGPYGSHTSAVPLLAGAPVKDPRAAFDWCWLRLPARPTVAKPRGVLRIVDLFTGCGQMTIGASEAGRAIGLRTELALAVDLEAAATRLCSSLFPEADVRTDGVERLFDRDPGHSRSVTERRLVADVGDVDLLVGGPPCQGHSDLNNHTRRDDGRNVLALKMVRCAELMRPRFVLMENVRGIVHDRQDVFGQVRRGLVKLGYHIAERVVNAEHCGVPQRRHRVFLLGARDDDPAPALDLPRLPQRTFSWACGDLHKIKPDSPFDQSSTPTETNRRRIDYLFENATWELPDTQRPACHSGGGHTYKSTYGRLHWDRPAQTITTGFRSMGQGRFVHPKSRRTITAHEAARLQFIPDFVHFDGASATATATLIGNAVPPKLVYAIVLNLLLAPWTLPG